jgi:hypothetical protein
MLEAVKSFPEFIFGLVVGLIVAILTDVEVFLFAITGVLLSLGLDNGFLGAGIALALFTMFRMFSKYVGVTRGQSIE